MGLRKSGGGKILGLIRYLGYWGSQVTSHWSQVVAAIRKSRQFWLLVDNKVKKLKVKSEKFF